MIGSKAEQRRKVMEQNDNRLVSILLPVYNGAQYINQLLNSIKSQTYRPIELIIADDCSKDDSLRKIRRWAKQNEDIGTVIIEGDRNLGLSGNFARTYPYIKGEYVFIADQDDIWDKDKVFRQVEYLKNNPDCIMCICDRSIIDGKGKLLHNSEATYLKRKKRKMNFKQVICEPSIYAANCMAIRNQHLEDIFTVPKRIVEHDTYIATMASYYGNIGFLQKPLIRYRIHTNNLSGSFTIETTNNLIRCFRSRIKVNDKINRVKENDGAIIAAILKKKYNVDIYNINNKLVNYELKNVYLSSIIDVVEAVIEGKLNYFNKKKE